MPGQRIFSRVIVEYLLHALLYRRVTQRSNVGIGGKAAACWDTMWLSIKPVPVMWKRETLIWSRAVPSASG